MFSEGADAAGTLVDGLGDGEFVSYCVNRLVNKPVGSAGESEGVGWLNLRLRGKYVAHAGTHTHTRPPARVHTHTAIGGIFEMFGEAAADILND